MQESYYFMTKAKTSPPFFTFYINYIADRFPLERFFTSFFIFSASSAQLFWRNIKKSKQKTTKMFAVMPYDTEDRAAAYRRRVAPRADFVCKYCQRRFTKVNIILYKKYFIILQNNYQIRPITWWSTSAVTATTSPTPARCAGRPSSARTIWSNTGDFSHFKISKKERETNLYMQSTIFSAYIFNYFIIQKNELSKHYLAAGLTRCLHVSYPGFTQASVERWERHHKRTRMQPTIYNFYKNPPHKQKKIFKKTKQIPFSELRPAIYSSSLRTSLLHPPLSITSFFFCCLRLPITLLRYLTYYLLFLYFLKTGSNSAFFLESIRNFYYMDKWILNF